MRGASDFSSVRECAFAMHTKFSFALWPQSAAKKRLISASSDPQARKTIIPCAFFVSGRDWLQRRARLSIRFVFRADFLLSLSILQVFSSFCFSLPGAHLHVTEILVVFNITITTSLNLEISINSRTRPALDYRRVA